jgi:hypothetical protein
MDHRNGQTKIEKKNLLHHAVLIPSRAVVNVLCVPLWQILFNREGHKEYSPVLISFFAISLIIQRVCVRSYSVKKEIVFFS